MLNSKVVKSEKNSEKKITPIKLLSWLVRCLRNIQICLTRVCPQRHLHHPTLQVQQSEQGQQSLLSVHYEVGNLGETYSGCKNS